MPNVVPMVASAALTGPKARRIEVWLQPQTVELLDALCKQWSVGRGKVIDQLVTRGPVAPKIWEEVEASPKPTPTPSAPKQTSSPEDDPEWDVFEDISDLTEVLGYSPQECLRYLKGAIDELTEWAKTVPECKQRLADYQAEIKRLDIEVRLADTRFADPKNPPIQTRRKHWATCVVMAHPDKPNSCQLPLREWELPVSSKFISEEFGFKDTPCRVPQQLTDMGFRDYWFAVHIPTGTVWSESIKIPDHVADYARQEISKRTSDQTEYEGVKPNDSKPSPAPTDGDRIQSAVDSLNEFQRKHQAEWTLIKAEADRLKVNAKDLSRLLAALKIPQTFPISVDAEQAVRRELEDEHRARLGNDNAKATYIAKVQQLVANGTGACELDELLDGCEGADPRPDVARKYLFNVLPKVGLPEYRKLVSSIWGKLLALVSNGDPAIIKEIQSREKELLGSPERRCLFWGALLRSPHIDDGGAEDGKFLEWIQYSVHDNYRERQSARRASDVLSGFGFGTSESDARRVLGLPLEIELTRAGIKKAWIQAAQKAHPDKGGTNEEMHAIEEAKNRLLLTVNT